jgi:hypothetical protein
VAGQLNWTKLRLVSSVATSESVEEWLAAAKRCASSELERLVRSARQPMTGAADTPAPTTNAEDETSDEIDGEPRVHLRIRCPAPVRSLWRTVYELASRSSGSILAQWQALELVAAEAMSNVDLDSLSSVSPGIGPVDGQRTDERDGDWAIPDRGSAHDDETTGQGRWHDGVDLAELRALLAVGDASALGGVSTVGDASTVGDGPACSALAGAPIDRDQPLPELSPAEIDAELRATLRSMQAVDWQMGCLLRTFVRLRLYRNAGFRTLAEYVSERLGISVRKARGLVRLEADPSAGRSELAQAYRTGGISWVRALVLLPVLSEEYTAAWLERACQVTVRRLIEEVRWAGDMLDRTGRTIAMAPPPLGSPLEFSEAEAARQIRARCGEEREASMLRSAQAMEVTLDFSGPASVIAFVHDVLRAYRMPSEAPWRGFERMLLHAKDVWEAVERHRNPIHERDGWRCRVPACSSRRNLQEHHLLFRSQGGGNERTNRVSICAWHHLRGIHAGVVRAHGDAASEVRWQLGEGAFLSFRNDVYVQAPVIGSVP